MFEDDIGLKPFNRLNLTLPLKRQAIDSAGCKHHHLYLSTLDRYIPTNCSFYGLKPIIMLLPSKNGQCSKMTLG